MNPGNPIRHTIQQTQQKMKSKLTNDKPATRRFLPGSLILASALALSSTAHGALIAYEGFDYPDGTLNGRNGGTGAWNGAWASGGGTVSGGEFFTGANNQSSSRPITVAASTDPIYFSASFTKTGTNSAYAWWLQLGASSDPNSNDVVRIGLANDEFSVRIRQGGTEIDGDTGTYIVGNTVSIIGKLEYNVDSTTNERLTIWVDPTAEETATISSSVLGNVGWTTPTHVHMRNFLNAGEGSMDDIRVGSSWASVIPEPSTALLGALGMLCLLRRRR